MARLALKALAAAFVALVAAPVQAQQARVVTSCGSLAPFGAQAAGSVAFPTVDTTGKLCLSGGGGGGSIVGGTTPVTGTCPSGQFLYNNSGVVGCSASSATIALPQAITGGVSGGIPYFSAATTMSAGALLANNSIMLGGGAAASPKTTTTGTGVVTALGVNTNAAGGVALVSTVPTAGNFVKWAAGGLVDGGAGSSTITAGTTATSGFTAGQAIYSDGSLAQAAGSYYSANLSSQRNGVTAQAERVYNTYSAGTADEWGTFDWTTTGSVLTIGTAASGTGASRSINFVVGGTTELSMSTLGVQLPTSGGIFGNPGTQIGAAVFYSAGSSPTIAGGSCSMGTVTKVGGTSAGTFSPANACATATTILITGMVGANNGYACDAMDRTTPTALIQQTASTTTGVTFTVAGVTTGAGNVIQWKCIAY